jgi:uncharacterized metal-binding protein YceD (DUF177 family)
MDHPSDLEFSRPIAESTIEAVETTLEIEADATECCALATRFDLLSLDFLKATLHLVRTKGDAIHLEGCLKARLSQSCVVTLEPVFTDIEAKIERHYDPKVTDDDIWEKESTTAEADSPQDSAKDLPDPLVEGIIDLGEAAAEQLSLEIPLFPRKPGATFEQKPDDSGTSSSGQKTPSPFSVLAKLKSKSQ